MLQMIFLAEDDDATREALSTLLNAEEMPVRDYPSCDALWSDAEPQDNDCLVLDVHMEGTTGLELLERLRREGQTVPVILMTAGLTPAIRDRAVEAGAAAIFEKPFDVNALIGSIRNALGTAPSM